MDHGIVPPHTYSERLGCTATHKNSRQTPALVLAFSYNIGYTLLNIACHSLKIVELCFRESVWFAIDVIVYFFVVVLPVCFLRLSGLCYRYGD